jgi:hypothetical protein
VGITSTSNRAFVAGLGCYDSVITYDEVDALPAERSVLVDMAGSGRVRRLVHERLGDQLQFSSSVGATHWEDATIGAGSQNLPGPAPSLFFAPSQAEKRLADWGREAFEARLATAWEGFLQAAEDWIDVERCEGPDALERVYAAFVSGSADPSKGYVASL